MEIVSGKKENFFKFLDKLNKKDKIAILSHIDLDGITSAIIINEILKSKKLKYKTIKFINYQPGVFKEIIPELEKKKINKIFIADISVDSDYEGYKELKERFKIFVVDHHPFENEDIDNMIKTESSDCATFSLFQLTKEYFKEEKINLEKLKELVCATMICEFSYNKKENLQYIQSLYPEITPENAYENSSLGDICKKISSTLICFNNKEKKVFNMVLKGKLNKMEKYDQIIKKAIDLEIKKFEKEEEFFPEKKIHIYFENSKFKIASTISTILSMKKPDETFVFFSENLNDLNMIKVSSRNQNGKEEVNLLMKKAIQGLEHATGGGHLKAAGANFMKKDLQKFKENLLK